MYADGYEGNGVYEEVGNNGGWKERYVSYYKTFGGKLSIWRKVW